MAFRFRTRLSIWVSLLTTSTIIVMSGVLLTVASGVVLGRYMNQGRIVTSLAARNAEHAIHLPERVLATVGEQMVVSSLLTGELVDLAESEGHDADDIAWRLQRVIERSKSVRGYPLVDEFWITDETGTAYIHTAPDPFVFRPDPDGVGQAGAFLDLLLPDAAPVIQELQARELDGKPFMYAGTSGVDKPRIVQLGVSKTLVDSVRADYRLEEALEGFLDDMEVARIAVVDPDGTTLAALGEPLNPGEALVDREVREFCRAYLRNPNSDAFAVKDIVDQAGNRFIGVVTRIPLDLEGGNVALFMQYQTEGLAELLRFNVRVILTVGSALLAAALLLSLWLGRRLSQPLGQLNAAVQSFGRGGLAERVRIRRAYREVQELASTFNTMADRIQSYTRELEEATVLRERLESEMRIGAEVQRSLLPERPPDTDAFDISGISIQAREVGGDFFDFIERADGTTGVAIGDATDKGLPAALLSSQCASMFHVLAESGVLPAAVLGQTNRALFQKISDTGRFVTAFLCYCEGRDGTVRYANAGHNPPLRIRADDGGIERLSCDSGLPLGVRAACRYQDSETRLGVGDLLVLYSDGITEAMNPQRELYGEARLTALLQRLAPAQAAEAVEKVLEDVREHCGGNEPGDDITLIVVRYLGTGKLAGKGA